MSKYLFIIFTLLSISKFVMGSTPDNEQDDLCEEQWLKESAIINSEENPDFKILLEKWKKYSSDCEKTEYDARLALIYSYLGENDMAKNIIAKIDKNSKSKYLYLVDVIAMQIVTNEKTINKTLDENYFNELATKYYELDKKYPNSIEINSLLGGVLVLQEKYTQAIPILAKALKPTNHDKTGLFRNLTIAFSGVKDYENAYKVGNAAYARKKSLLSDPDFVIAIANANSGMKKFEDAQLALKIIATKVPEVVNDPKFIEAVKFATQQ